MASKETPVEEPVVISKIFGKINNRPTKKEFQQELLESDMENMSRAMYGNPNTNKKETKGNKLLGSDMDKMSRAMKGDSNTLNKKATKVDKHLAKMLANHPKLRYTSA